MDDSAYNGNGRRLALTVALDRSTVAAATLPVARVVFEIPRKRALGRERDKAVLLLLEQENRHAH